MYNMSGMLIVGTYVLVPIAVAPIYATMKTVPPDFRRAAISLGAKPFTAFWRIYFPLTLPGVGAALTIEFMIALGYYVVPALVGGAQGQFISSSIAQNMLTTLNWGLAGALSILLLVITLALFPLYAHLSRDRKAQP